MLLLWLQVGLLVLNSVAALVGNHPIVSAFFGASSVVEIWFHVDAECMKARRR